MVHVLNWRREIQLLSNSSYMGRSVGPEPAACVYRTRSLRHTNSLSKSDKLFSAVAIYAPKHHGFQLIRYTSTRSAALKQIC